MDSLDTSVHAVLRRSIRRDGETDQPLIEHDHANPPKMNPRIFPQLIRRVKTAIGETSRKKHSSLYRVKAALID
jgi:hypothetical protein